MMKVRNLLVPLCVLLVVFAVGNLQAQGPVYTQDFETDLGDWTNAGGGAATVSLSTEMAYSGVQSLKAVGKDDHGQINIRNDVHEDFLEGDAFSVTFYISSADLALVNGFQLFWQDAGWGWAASWTDAGSVTGDAWNTLVTTVPAYTAPPSAIGFQVVDLNTISEVTVYVDDISISRAGAAGVVVDGQKDAFFDALVGPDDGYVQLQVFHGTPEVGTPEGDNTDLSAKIWGAWDAEWFYLYVEVTDDVISLAAAGNDWQTDAMELKIDGVPDDSVATGMSSAVIFTAIDPANDPVNAGICDNLDDVDAANKIYARQPMAGGYVLEYAIKIDALGGSEAIVGVEDGIFGLGMHIIDNDGAG
ncbi:hypothetical protein HQ585_19500, partial [candidate division KSB1 bacterium]|nr:hypothetical protein [candidate division KSB1 bacterium]